METAGKVEPSRRRWLAPSSPGRRNQARSGSAFATGIGGARGPGPNHCRRAGRGWRAVSCSYRYASGAAPPAAVAGQGGQASRAAARRRAAAFRAVSAVESSAWTTPLPAHGHARFGNSLDKLFWLCSPNAPRKSEPAASDVEWPLRVSVACSSLLPESTRPNAIVFSSEVDLRLRPSVTCPRKAQHYIFGTGRVLSVPARFSTCVSKPCGVILPSVYSRAQFLPGLEVEEFLILNFFVKMYF